MKSDTVTPERTALLLVDLQNDFVEGGALAVPAGGEVIEVANRLMQRFEFVVATQDWHPADHQSFASQHSGLQLGDTFTLGGLPQIAWPDHCVQGSSGAEFVEALDCDAIDYVVRKGTDSQIDSYSGFYDNGRKKATGLSDFLRENRVMHLVVLGLATDYCVRATVLDALSEGFAVTLVVDGCRGVELHEGDIHRATVEMQSAGARLLNSHDL